MPTGTRRIPHVYSCASIFPSQTSPCPSAGSPGPLRAQTSSVPGCSNPVDRGSEDSVPPQSIQPVPLMRSAASGDEDHPAWVFPSFLPVRPDESTRQVPHQPIFFPPTRSIPASRPSIPRTLSRIFSLTTSCRCAAGDNARRQSLYLGQTLEGKITMIYIPSRWGGGREPNSVRTPRPGRAARRGIPSRRGV